MHLPRSLLVVALVTTLALAGPRGGRFFRRTGDDDTDKDVSFTIALSSTATLSKTSSSVLSSTYQFSTLPLKDVPSTTSPPTISNKDETASTVSTSDKDKDTTPSPMSTPDKDKSSSTVSISDEDKGQPASTTLTTDNDRTLTSFLPFNDKTTSIVPAKDQTASSSVPAKDLPPTTSVGIPLGTGPSSSLDSTQEIVVTDIVYTTLTTCPVTSTVTSGNSEIEKITTAVSTVTLTSTSTSTICTKCVAPPKSKPETPSTLAGHTVTSILPSFVVYSLTQPSSTISLPTNLTSSVTGVQTSGGPPVIVYSLTLPKAPLTTGPSSKPEKAVFSAAISPSKSLVFPSRLSLTVGATSETSSLVIPGYSIVPSPTSIPGGAGPFSNASSSIVPVFSPALLGNAYGGGFVLTPSIYVTKLTLPSGLSEGSPPGYGSTSTPKISPTITPAFSVSLVETVSSPEGFIAGSLLDTILFNATTNTVAVGNGSSIFTTVAASQSSPTITSGLSVTLIEVVSTSGGAIAESSVGTISLSIPTNIVAAGNGSSMATISAVSKSETGNATSNIGVALGDTALATSNTEFGQTSIAIRTSLGATIPPTLYISGFSSGVEQTAVSQLPSASFVPASASTIEFSIQTSPPTEVPGSTSPGPTGVASITKTSGLSATSVGALASPSTAVFLNTPTTGFMETVPVSSFNAAATLVSSAAASARGQIPASKLNAAAVLTPIIGANGLTSLAVVASTNLLTPLAVGPTPAAAANGVTTTTTTSLAPVQGVNGLSSIAVIPSPVIGANGLTSLAVFSTPIADANGLASPAVILTPVVGANGLTSLAVLATPVVGANGLTSLAVGLASEQANAGQPIGTPSPVQESLLVGSPLNLPASEVAIPILTIIHPMLPSSPVVPSIGFGRNASVHVLLNPTAIAEFQGSAVRLSLGYNFGMIGLLVFLFLL